jgi:hypothetical protein
MNMPATMSVLPTDATLHEALAARAVEPTEPEARQSAVADLLALAGDRTEPLERVRAEFQRRLARRSDDFEATHALRLVEGALVQAKRPDGPWAEEARRRY